MPNSHSAPRASTSTVPTIASTAQAHTHTHSAFPQSLPSVSAHIAAPDIVAEGSCEETLPLIDDAPPEEQADSTLRRRMRRNFLLSAGIATAAAAVSAFSSAAPLAQAQTAEDKHPTMLRSRQSGAGGLPALPSLPVIALNRMAYGPRPGDIAAFNALGSSPVDRLTAYVDQQLNPNAIDDSACDAIIAGYGFTTLQKSRTQLWADHVRAQNNPWNNRMLPATETEQATFLKAVYSKRQLEQVLAEHWFNHFNIYGWDSWTGPVMVHYDRDVIRANLLGNFRTMLEAVAKSPAMLYYLDNQSNSGGNPNENYARELFELHAMGAENYLGVVPLIINGDGSYTHPAPKDNSGTPLLYVDADVYGATTCFTGWRIDGDTGNFLFDDDAHFPYAKIVLGRLIPEAQGIKDGSDVLDLVAKHPGTARYLCRKLCRRLISDDPPESVVQAAADVYMANVNAPDQLRKVTRTILLSNEFRSTWAQKIKRPFEYTVSILRAADAKFTPNSSFLYTYDALGQPLFSWSPPNGYPDEKASWSSTMPMLQRWRLVHFLTDWKIGGDGTDKDDRRLNFVTPASVKTPNAVVNYWAQRLLGYSLPANEQQSIVEFLAAGRNPDLDLPDDQLVERLPYAIGLIFMAPAFQWR
ncbi:MAG TPA: DUF1800 domain-containing protein [Caldilineaceae bacterium]|nr:DUF1800 domain-containing protein [Caldilineaceae bacterium]